MKCELTRNNEKWHQIKFDVLAANNVNQEPEKISITNISGGFRILGDIPENVVDNAELKII